MDDARVHIKDQRKLHGEIQAVNKRTIEDHRLHICDQRNLHEKIQAANEQTIKHLESVVRRMLAENAKLKTEHSELNAKIKELSETTLSVRDSLQLSVDELQNTTSLVAKIVNVLG
jgi:predicted RNase H-like nuclease (RuvC/YqgF family)